MSSIVIHIRFTEEILAHAVDGIEKLQLPPPTTLNDIIRTATQAGLAVMCGHDWTHRTPSQSGYERVRFLTKQPMKSQPSDLILAALNRQTTSLTSTWDRIDANTTTYTMPKDDWENADRIWALMSEGHVTIHDQLTCNDGTVDRIASYLLWHHKEHFPDDLELITKVYGEYWMDT